MRQTFRGLNTVRNGRALFLVTGLLLASSGIRIGTYTGSALARETDEPPTLTTENADITTCESNTPEISTVLDALRQREERIKKKEMALIEKDAALALANEEIQRNLILLEQAESQLESTLALSDKAAEVDLASLTSVYENMKPKEASALFEEMDVAFAAGFLGRMRPDVAASILSGLSAQKAYSISVVLAGRNASAPIQKK